MRSVPSGEVAVPICCTEVTFKLSVGTYILGKLLGASGLGACWRSGTRGGKPRAMAESAERGWGCPALTDRADNSVFHHEFFLLVNVAVGGTASVPPDTSVTFPQTMLIDYVRLYEPAARRS